MPDNSINPTGKTSKEKRVLTEFGTKIENEDKRDDIIEARKPDNKSLHDVVAFDCECDDKGCKESISMSTEEYKRLHLKTNKFVVVQSHVHLDIEEIITTFSDYVTVAKLFPQAAT